MIVIINVFSLTVLVSAPSTIIPSLNHSIVDIGFAPRDTQVRLYVDPAVNRISGEPSITGPSGGTTQTHRQMDTHYLHTAHR